MDQLVRTSHGSDGSEPDACTAKPFCIADEGASPSIDSDYALRATMATTETLTTTATRLAEAFSRASGKSSEKTTQILAPAPQHDNRARTTSPSETLPRMRRPSR